MGSQFKGSFGESLLKEQRYFSVDDYWSYVVWFKIRRTNMGVEHRNPLRIFEDVTSLRSEMPPIRLNDSINGPVRLPVRFKLQSLERYWLTLRNGRFRYSVDQLLLN